MGKLKYDSDVTGLDSGWSWIIAGACCFVNCTLYGVTRLSGMLLQPAVETFGVSRGEAAVPFTTSSAVRNLSGPIVGFLGHHFGIRPVTAAGCILAALGAGLCFLATDIIWTTVFWGGIYGIGLGLATSLLPSAINENFKKNAATASGISYAGSFIGSFIFPPLVLLLLDEYSLRGTFLILSGFILNSLVAVVLLKPPCMPCPPSSRQPVYTISKKRNSTERNALKQVKIDDPNTSNPKCKVRDTIDHQVIQKDVGNKEIDIYDTTKFHDLLPIKELSEKNTEPATMAANIFKPSTIFPAKTETSHKFLGFIAFTKNSAPSDGFTKQEHFKIPSAEKEKPNFFTNFFLSDVIHKIREHLTKNKNRNSDILEKSVKRNGVFLELSDSQRNIYHVSQLSGHSTKALVRELRNNRFQSDNKTLSNSEDLILLAISQDRPVTNEIETSKELQKFIKWNEINKNIMLDFSQNCLKGDETQMNSEVKENPTSNKHLGNPAFACNTSLLGRLTRSFKHKTSTAEANIHRKSLPLSSKDENSPNVELTCRKWRKEINPAHIRTNNESENVEVPVSLTDANHNRVPLENANKLLSESNKQKCDCSTLNTLPHEMALKNRAEEHVESMPMILVFLNKEKFLKDVPLVSEGHLLQSNCAAILLLQSRQNNRADNLNFRVASNSEKVDQLNKANENVSNSFTDQNQNFLDAKGVSHDSKGGDYSVIVMNADQKAEHITVGRRFRSWCSVFSNPAFLLISVTMAVFSFIMVCILTVIEDYARDIDHPHSPKGYVLMILSAADLCGTVGLGWITDRRFLTRKNFISICFFGMAACTMIIAFTTHIVTLCILVALYGLFESGVIITFPLLTAEYIRVDKQTIAIASSNLLSAPVILLVPVVIGYFRDHLGSYHKLFCVLSVTSSACGLLWILVPVLLQKYSLKFRSGLS